MFLFSKSRDLWLVIQQHQEIAERIISEKGKQ